MLRLYCLAPEGTTTLALAERRPTLAALINLYQAAKIGDADAAAVLVNDTISPAQIDALRQFIGGRKPTLVSAHAYENEGVNAIPEAFAAELGKRLRLSVDSGIVQTNMVGHTGADGYTRLARQATFDGPVTPGKDYILVDDFVGMGGTLANLKGYIEANGGVVMVAVTLTGKPYSAKLTLDKSQLNALRDKHGTDLESCGEKGSITPSTSLLNQKLGTSPAPRMLTPSEIKLLRQSKQEIGARVMALTLLPQLEPGNPHFCAMAIFNARICKKAALAF